MSAVVYNKIYVAGGYSGNNLRLKSFECYSEKLNIWEKMGISLIEPIESCSFIILRSTNNFDVNKILILGGRNEKGDSD